MNAKIPIQFEKCPFKEGLYCADNPCLTDCPIKEKATAMARDESHLIIDEVHIFEELRKQVASGAADRRG